MTLFTAATILLRNATGTLFDTVQQIIIFGAMAVCYDFFSGYTGYYNLGFGAFAGIGAYAFAFSDNAGVNIFLAFLIAGIAAAMFSAAMSYPFLRLRGAYFAIGTLALVLLLYYIDINLPQYTSGVIGLYVKSSQTTSLEIPLMVGSLGFLLLVMWIHHSLSKSRLGLALRSIREEEDVSESFGVNAFRMKQYAMILSGFFGGMSGALLALYFGFINSANMLGLSGAFIPVVAAMVGGSGIFLGPLVGSFIFTGLNLNLPSFLISIDPSNPSISSYATPLAISGLLLVLVGLFFPAGLLRLKAFSRYAYLRPDRLLTKYFKRSQPQPANPKIPQPAQKKSAETVT
jgi:branched-chain amino acid transport system permease protein